jgi:uncharacterized protein (TIGR02453 family)
MSHNRSPFSSRTLAFLRALKRHNDREWFKARRDAYDRDVREPMTAVITRLASDFRRFAPELVASPQQSLYRVYRDTRFSENKQPLKTHAAAVFPWRGLQRHEGAGLYFEVACDWVWIGGGMYAPPTPELTRVREHIAETWPEIHTLVRRPSFRQRVGTVDGHKLSRAPRGFPTEHPAVEYLKHRQFIAGREFPASFAHSRAFYPTLVATFRALMPLIRFLNEPLLPSRTEVRGARRVEDGLRSSRLVSTDSAPAYTDLPPARQCTSPARRSAS